MASSAAKTRLRKHADYQRVYKTGRKQFGKQMAYFSALQPALQHSPGSAPSPRVGLTVPKALGKAVDRNRIKRRLRAAVRAALPLLTAPVDVVLHPRRSVLEGEFGAIAREVGVVFCAVQAAHDRGQMKARPEASMKGGTLEQAARPSGPVVGRASGRGVKP